VLGDVRDATTPSMLEQMHDLGVLAALMPEFGPLTGRALHDVYHVYTIDQHSLYAVACLKALARGEPLFARDHPTAVAAMREVEPAGRVVLCLGALLHDIGKPVGGNHSEHGARLAAEIALRFGLDEPDVRAVEYLVRHHLLLAHLSQRRDIDDGDLIARLAHAVRNVATLRQLYLLTFADMAMVAPDNLSEWKATLLRDLYVRTRAFLRSGPDLAGVDSSARVQMRKRQVVALLRDGGEGAAMLDSLPDRYYAQHPARAVVRHLRLCVRRQEQGRRVLLEVQTHRSRRYSVLTVCADDAPGLLASIAGVLVAHRIEVHTAEINSRARTGVSPGFSDEALDIFTVHDRVGRAVADKTRWQMVERDLERVLTGDITLSALIAVRREPTLLPAKVKPAVLTQIEMDNDISREFTVVDVSTQDRLGVLYTIACTLTEQQLDIHLSKVATEAERVADVFYVRDRETRAKLVDAERLEALRAALEAALTRLARDGI
jgi:[protein-PII] uridylyltransferase